MRRAHIDSNHSNSNNNYGAQQDQIEEENQHLEQGLTDKVKALKFLSIDIGNEVREQNKYLTSMDDDFDKSDNFLSSTMKRVQLMARAGHNRYIFYLLGFCLFVFIVCWLIMKSR